MNSTVFTKLVNARHSVKGFNAGGKFNVESTSEPQLMLKHNINTHISIKHLLQFCKNDGIKFLNARD